MERTPVYGGPGALPHYGTFSPAPEEEAPSASAWSQAKPPRIRQRSRSQQSARVIRRMSTTAAHVLAHSQGDGAENVTQSLSARLPLRSPTSFYNDQRPLRPRRVISARTSVHSSHGAVDPFASGHDGNPITVDAGAEQIRRVEYSNFVSIDWANDLMRESLRRREFRQFTGFSGSAKRLYYASQAWLLVASIGIVGACFAAYIDIVGDWLSDLKEGYCADAFYLAKAYCCSTATSAECCTAWVTWPALLQTTFELPDGPHVWWFGFLFYTLFACLFSTLAATLVKVYAPYAAGSGIPEVKTILGGFIIRKFLGFWTLIIKTLGLALATASGLNLGKEGPLVHVVAAIGNILSRLFPKFAYNEAKKREILAASSAAGVSVAFGAPIGGVLFALEEVSTYFGANTMFRSFLCAMIGAFTLRLLNPFRSGKLVLYEVTYKTVWHDHDVPFFIALGIFGGIVGAGFIHANLRVANFRRSLKASQWPIREVFFVTLATAVCSYPMLLLRTNLGRLVSNLFKECSEVDPEFSEVFCQPGRAMEAIQSLVIAFVAKIVLVTWTFGIRVPSGIFLPPLAIGALAGRALGIALHTWQRSAPDHFLFSSCREDAPPCISPGLYALVGAAAALGGVTRMTVSLTVIVFELTGVLDYVLPIMIALMVAKWTGDAFGKESIYEGLITLNSLPYLSPRLDYLHPYPISEIMTPSHDLHTIASYGATIAELKSLLILYDYQQFPIVDSDLTLVGIVGSRELQYALEEAVLNGAGEDTSCVFEEEHGGVYLPDSHGMQQEPDELGSREGEVGAAPVNLRSWIDTTPFCVQSNVSVQWAIDYFTKLGLRYIVVTDNGYLKGMVTKKDLLRHLVAVGESAGFEKRLFAETDRERKLTAGVWHTEDRILD